MALPESFAVVCRGCGTPFDPSGSTCTHCGCEVVPDEATRARLLRHRARMRRTLQELRARITPAVAAALLPPDFRTRAVVAFLAVVASMILVPTLIAGAGFFLFGDSAAAFAFVLLALASAAGVLVFGVRRTRRWLVGFSLRARVEARRRLGEIAATTPCRCRGCGGHAAVVALGRRSALPCPWCGTPQLPGPSLDDARHRCLDALIERHEDLTRDALERAGFSAPPRPKGLPDAFEPSAGGTVVAGSSRGVDVAAFQEMVDQGREARVVQRLEVDHDTGLGGEVFVAAPGVESTLRRMAGEWGYELPSEGIAAAEERGFRVYGTADGRVADPILQPFLERMGDGEGLLMDPAGLSLWRPVSPWTRAWSLLDDRLALVVWLARSLR